MKRSARIALGLLAGSMLGIGLTLLRNSSNQLRTVSNDQDGDQRPNTQEEITLGEILDSTEEPTA